MAIETGILIAWAVYFLGVAAMFLADPSIKDASPSLRESLLRTRAYRLSGMAAMLFPVGVFLALATYVLTYKSTTGAEGWYFVFGIVLFGLPAAISFVCGMLIFIYSYISDDSLWEKFRRYLKPKAEKRRW